MDEALDTAGLWPIKEYIQRRQDTVSTKVDLQPIYEMYTGKERMPVTSRFMQ